MNKNTVTFAVNVQINMKTLQDPCTLLYHSNVDRDIASANVAPDVADLTYGSLFLQVRPGIHDCESDTRFLILGSVNATSGSQ